MKKVVPAVPKYEATKSLLNACHAAMYEGAKNLASAYATIQQQQFILAAGAAWKPIPQFVPSQLTEKSSRAILLQGIFRLHGTKNVWCSQRTASA